MANIGDLTATLRANTTDFTAKMDAATASSAKLALALQDPVAQLRQLGIAAGQATGEQRALLVAQQQAIIEGMKAKGLVIVNGQVAYSATAAAEATTAMAAAQTEASVAGAGFMSNASRLERSLGSLTTRMAGIPMQVGSIGVSLGRSILGTAGALAAVAAISLIFVALSGLIEHFRAAAKAAEESATRIQAAFKKLTLADQYTDAQTAADKLAAGEQALAELIARTNQSLTARRALLQRAASENNKDIFGVDAAGAKAALAALPVDAAHDPQVMALQEKVNLLRIANQAAQKQLQEAQGPTRGYNTKDAGTGVAKPDRAIAPPTTPGRPDIMLGFSVGPTAEELIAQYQRSLATADLVAQTQRYGRTLSQALAQGVTEGDLTARLVDGLKRVFEDVIAKLIEQKIFAKLEQALVDALIPPSQPSGGGFLSFLGVGSAAAGTAITGGLGALAFSQAATGVAGGNALAKSGGTNGTLIVNASGSMPRALGPVEHARDAQWLALWSETARVAPSLGIKVGVT